MKTRENFWYVYCFTTNEMQETAKGNCQTAALISHDLTQNELAFSSTKNLSFQILKFKLIYQQIIDMEDTFNMEKQLL